MNRETFVKNIDLETYRQMFMFHVKFDQNVVTMLGDFARFRRPDENNDNDSGDEKEN